MPSGSEVKFEIGHVLFIDIVGYSKLLINRQNEQLETRRAGPAGLAILDPVYDNVRNEPRFQDLVAKIFAANQ
jgi:hypothetical protein